MPFFRNKPKKTARNSVKSDSVPPHNPNARSSHASPRQAFDGRNTSEVNQRNPTGATQAIDHGAAIPSRSPASSTASVSGQRVASDDGALPRSLRRISKNVPAPNPVAGTIRASSAELLSPRIRHRELIVPVRDTRGSSKGMPSSPISPYMPYTPRTPFAPHLTTREERAQEHKQLRRCRGPVTDDDLVKDGREIWGDVYR